MRARSLGVDEHSVIKTLVMEDEQGTPLIVLMHGDREVSTKELARQTGVRSIQPCKPEVANRHSGYVVGGTSALGTRHAMPVHAEATIFELSRIYLNGGSRGSWWQGLRWGKSVLATQFIAAGVRQGDPGIVVVFERAKVLRSTGRQFRSRFGNGTTREETRNSLPPSPGPLGG